MSVYKFEPNEIELACGVTTDDVARELPRVALRPNGDVWVDFNLSPALAGAVARTALGVERAEYIGMAKGVNVYARP